MISLAFYAQALITGDRLILGSSVEELKASEVICVNGCNMECATKVIKALGIQPKHSIKLMEEVAGIKMKGKLSDVEPEDVAVAVNYILKKIQH